jgi:hypothetical protein
MELLGDVGQVEARFGLLGEDVISVPNRCTLCVECTTGMKIFLATPDGPP